MELSANTLQDVRRILHNIWHNRCAGWIQEHKTETPTRLINGKFMLKWHNTENVSPMKVNSEKVYLCFCSSLHQGSAPKHAAGGTWAATAATAPCLGKFETRLRQEPREALSVVTPASRSPMCEVNRAVTNFRNFPSPRPESRDERHKLNDYFSNILCVNASLWTRMWLVFVD